MTSARTRQRARRLTTVAAALSCLLAVGCGDDPVETADPDPTPIALASVGLGSEQRLFGTVTDVLSVNSFELSGVLDSGEPLLVVTPDAAPLDAGTRVLVTGTVEELTAGDRSKYGLDGQDVPAAAVGSRFLLADSIDAPIGLED